MRRACWRNSKSRGEVRGEITLLIGKAQDNVPARSSSNNIAKRVRELMAAQKLDEKAALKLAAKEFGFSKSAAYRELQRDK